MKKMSLDNAPKDKILKVQEINLSKDIKRKLISLGIQVDDLLMKLNDTGRGPILFKNISNDSSKIALDRGLADKIIVDYGK